MQPIAKVSIPFTVSSRLKQTLLQDLRHSGYEIKLVGYNNEFTLLAPTQKEAEVLKEVGNARSRSKKAL